MTIVYDIQRPQGTQENTLDPAPFNPVPMIEGAAQGLTSAIQAYGKASSDSGTKKDYGPLVQALNTYRDTVQAKESSPAYQQKLWDSLVEWAASQGYTHADIDGYAGTTHTDIPDNSLKAYIQDKQVAVDARQKALRERARANYPDLDADEAMEMELLNLSDSLNIKSIGATSQSMPAQVAQALIGNNAGILERYVSSAIDRELRKNGGPVSSSDLTIAINGVMEELSSYGINPEKIAYLESFMYNLYESRTKEGNQRLQDISQNYEHREKIATHDKNMLEISNGIKKATTENAWLSTPYTYTLTDKDNKKQTITMTGAHFGIVRDVSPTTADILMYQNPGAVPAIMASLATEGGTKPREMTQTESMIFSKREYADFVDSSANDSSRKNGAATQMNGLSNSLKDILGGPIDPRSRTSDFLKIITQNIKLKPEDYQSSDQQILHNKETAKGFLEAMGRALGHELPNSLPIFNDKGELRMLLVNKVGDRMVSEDITEGYSMFSDRNTFDRYYKTGVPAALQNLSNATGWSIKELQQLWNDSMIRYSDTGYRVAQGTQTRGRHFSSESPYNANTALTDAQVQDALKTVLSNKAPANVLGIYDRDVIRDAINRNVTREPGITEDVVSAKDRITRTPKAVPEIFNDDDHFKETLESLPVKEANEFVPGVKGVTRIAKGVYQIEDSAKRDLVIPEDSEVKFLNNGQIWINGASGRTVVVQGADIAGREGLSVKLRKGAIIGEVSKGATLSYSDMGTVNPAYETGSIAYVSEEPARDEYRVLENSNVIYNDDRTVTNESSPNAEVISPKAGEVLFAGKYQRNNSAVIIKDQEGYLLSIEGAGLDPRVSKGDMVNAGDILARAGNSGKVTVVKTYPEGSGKPKTGLESRVPFEV